MTGGAYVFPVWKAGVQHTVMVWNVAIVQMGRGSNGRTPPMKMIATVLREQGSDSVILWARDTKTYERIRDDLKLRATRNFDGSEKTRQ